MDHPAPPAPDSWDRDPIPEDAHSWVTAETTRVRALLAGVPQTQQATAAFAHHRRVLQHWHPRRAGGPWLVGSRFDPELGALVGWISPRDGAIDPRIFWRPLRDPASSQALHRLVPSPDGSRCVVTCRSMEVERDEVHLVRLPGGEPEGKPWHAEEHTPIVWAPDSEGFLYHEPRRNENRGFLTLGFFNVRQRMHCTQVGWFPGTGFHSATADHRYVIEQMRTADGGNDCRIAPFAPCVDFDFKRLPQARGSWRFITGAGDDLYFLSNENHPHFEALHTTVRAPDQQTVLIPASTEMLFDIHLAQDRLLVHSLDQGAARLRIYDRAGTPLHEIPLPPLSHLDRWIADPGSPVAHFHGSSLANPGWILRVDSQTGESAMVLEETLEGYHPDSVTLTREWATSADGTRIPLFILAPADRPSGEPRPLMLEAHGGFRRQESLWFEHRLIPWVQAGGVLVQAVPRGTGILGTEWYRASLGPGLARVVEDVIACAGHLIDRGYTIPDRLGLQGASHGGLVMANAAMQRPELFRAVVCMAPITDLLAYKRYGADRLSWRFHYGDPDDPDAAEHLQRLSPFHLVRDGVSYPAMLLVAPAQDPVVNPIHSWKFAARLQQATSSDRPILLISESQERHSSDFLTPEEFQDRVDVLGFLAWQLGLDLG
ncbi:MAG TPA: prolyl oligopeptidase family serine peptidase [bacterium]|nr:prolyl oligopeptidase family serine peptidase [bacterium]